MRRKQIQALLGQLDVSDRSDLRDLFREIVGGTLENDLKAAFDEGIGYSKYDHKNKTVTNSRNGHSRKTMNTSFSYITCHSEGLGWRIRASAREEEANDTCWRYRRKDTLDVRNPTYFK